MEFHLRDFKWIPTHTTSKFKFYQHQLTTLSMSIMAHFIACECIHIHTHLHAHAQHSTWEGILVLCLCTTNVQCLYNINISLSLLLEHDIICLVHAYVFSIVVQWMLVIFLKVSFIICMLLNDFPNAWSHTHCDFYIAMFLLLISTLHLYRYHVLHVLLLYSLSFSPLFV